MGEPGSSQPEDAAAAEGSPGAVDLAYELSGSMPCASCGYDLAGLSVLDRCPECGTRIRETLLLLIDPFDESVPKVRSPRLIACAVLGCTGGAFAASLALIVHRVAVLLCDSVGLGCGAGSLAAVGLGCLVVCALCVFGLVRPMRSTPLRSSVAALGGGVCLLAASGVAGLTLFVNDPFRAAPYFNASAVDPVRIIEHGAAHALALCAVLLIRPNARAISSTAWRVRENHENRQRLLTVAASLGVVLVGDLLMLGGGHLDATARVVITLCGELLVFASSCILAVALLGVLMDSVSIARTLWRIPVAFRDVVRRAAL